MKTLSLLIFTLLSASCCKKIDQVDHKVIEKIHTQNRGGTNIYYHLLFDNGKELSVEANVYVRAKEGDVWVFNECK
jgi:hypothetical protein